MMAFKFVNVWPTLLITMKNRVKNAELLNLTHCYSTSFHVAVSGSAGQLLQANVCSCFPSFYFCSG